VQNSVAFSAKRNQVGIGVITEGAAPSYVVNIEIRQTPTFLTVPTIAL
jgi:hypothetical protein